MILCTNILLWLNAVTEDTIHMELELERQYNETINKLKTCTLPEHLTSWFWLVKRCWLVLSNSSSESSLEVYINALILSGLDVGCSAAVVWNYW